MSQYTREQRNWLDDRFRRQDEERYYLAHQPIYGFRAEPSEPGHTFRYTITHRILQALSTIEFESILDAGGGEGYKAYLTELLWSSKVTLLDLSEQACRRGAEIFSLQAVTADLQALPFCSNAFDVVLCSERLEHVENYPAALEELLRITRKVLIITVPHEDHHGGPPDDHHAHINNFTLKSLNFLTERGFNVRSCRLLSPLLSIPSSLVDATPRQHNDFWKHPKVMTNIYNFLTPFSRRVFGPSCVVFLIWLDCLLCRLTPWHNGILFVVTKQGSNMANKPLRRISVRQILNSRVDKYKF